MRTQRSAFCSGRRSSHLPLSSGLNLGWEVELVMGSQPSILATAIDLLRKLCVNEAQVLRQVCAQGIGPFFHGP